MMNWFVPRIQLQHVLFVLIFRFCFGGNSLDFTDCGGDPITSIEIAGCEEIPCILKVDSEYNIKIRPEEITPTVDTSHIDVQLVQYGALFNQSTSVSNPCISSCPITNILIEPEFDVSFTVASYMVILPAYLQISGNYYLGTEVSGGFCAQLAVSIDK